MKAAALYRKCTQSPPMTAPTPTLPFRSSGRLLQKLRRLQKLRARSAAQKCLHGSEGGAFPGSGAQRHGKKLSRLLQNRQHLLALVFFHRNQHLQQRQCVPRGKAVCKPQRRL